jgi:hypothetical protein
MNAKIIACAVANPAAWVPSLQLGAVPNDNGAGWSVPTYALADDGEVEEGVIWRINSDGTGLDGNKPFGDPLDAVVLAGAAETRDEAAQRLTDRLTARQEPAHE